MGSKIRRITKKELENNVNPDEFLYLTKGQRSTKDKSGKIENWTNEAAIVSDQYLETRQGVDEDKKVQILLAKTLLENDLPGLTKREKQVIVLSIHGNTQQMIADQLEISRSAVRSYISRGRKKLKKLIPEFKEAQ